MHLEINFGPVRRLLHIGTRMTACAVVPLVLLARAATAIATAIPAVATIAARSAPKATGWNSCSRPVRVHLLRNALVRRVPAQSTEVQIQSLLKLRQKMSPLQVRGIMLLAACYWQR